MATEIQKGLSFITTFLLVFAAVTVVGTFLIINTFSILVAQRSREPRSGDRCQPSPGQPLGALRGFVVGLIGSTAGLVAGLLWRNWIRVLFGRFGLDMSGASLVLNPAPSGLVCRGLVVTMVVGSRPVGPAGAAGGGDARRRGPAEGALRKRIIVGLVLAILGGAAMYLGLVVVDSNELKWLGGGIPGGCSSVSR